MTKSDLIWAIREIDEDLIRDAPTKKLHTRPLRLALIAAAIVLLLSGTALGVYAGIHWSEIMETYFHADNDDKELMDSYTQTVYATAEQDGCTFRVTQLMGDEHCMVAALEILLPEELRNITVDTEELLSVAEANGYTREDVAWRLNIGYDYKELPERIHTPVSAETGFAAVHCGKEALLADTEELLSDYPDCGIYTKSLAIQDALSGKFFSSFDINGSAFAGDSPMTQVYDSETNTLTCLVSMHASIDLVGRPCTLVISEIFLEDLIATYSQPEDDSFELSLTPLLTEPVVLHFDATYQPKGQDYEIYQEDTLIGTMSLSPFTANLDFPQPPDDLNRLAPNTIDYLRDEEITVTLTDGSTVTYRTKTSGFLETQFCFAMTDEIVDLEKIEKITLLDYTFKPINN